MAWTIVLLIYVLGTLGLFIISCGIDKDRKTTSYVMISFFNSLLWPLLLLIIILFLIFKKNDDLDISDSRVSAELDRIIHQMEEEDDLKELQYRINEINTSEVLDE